MHIKTDEGIRSEQSGLNQRQTLIVEKARAEGFVSIDDLATDYDVTPQTIRRDIKLLCDQGILRRYHGGASLVSNTRNVDYSRRRELMKNQKEHIGQMVAEHIPDGASLFLNIGTTAEAVAAALMGHKNLRVVTNNINVASLLSQREDFEITIAGGRVRARDLAVVGEATIGFINQFKVDFGIVGISGIDEDGTLLDFDYREVRVAEAIMENSRTVYLATDHTKFGRRAMVKLGHLADLDGLFIDQMPDAPYAELLADSNIAVHVASDRFPGITKIEPELDDDI
ncbi:transcriptional regulator, DeoR family [Cohaesibacter sp. ES.047]|uniref:DeoR/GlpR family DNA-binding transcription regulator n=1 Tax=Cohaesibacter sp. ES.047 TaxID=1798205 RepID=UPI000BB96403|nr:DeoR family transcriptional regulator [Cohaesibacter sp. ES.047]SNY90173.1 transcriptional regulator, DeoR family [Cohaesibacter sp. ES.047]